LLAYLISFGKFPYPVVVLKIYARTFNIRQKNPLRNEYPNREIIDLYFFYINRLSRY
jgi:hypothetical protein